MSKSLPTRPVSAVTHHNSPNNRSLRDDYGDDVERDHGIPEDEYDFEIDGTRDATAFGESAEDRYSWEVEARGEGRRRLVALSGSLLILLAVFAVLLFLLNVRANQSAGAAKAGTSPTGLGSTAGLDTAPRTGALAPDFELLDVHTNKIVKLSSLRGKPVFINFWGTWCPPCRAEMPEMERLYSKYKDQIQILGVSMGPRDYPEQVKTFVDQYKYSWTFIHDPDYAVATTYQVVAVPSSYFIDKDGVIRALHVGAMTYDLLEANFQKTR